MNRERGLEIADNTEPLRSEKYERPPLREKEGLNPEKAPKPEEARREVEKAFDRAEASERPSQNQKESTKQAPNQLLISEKQKRQAYQQTMRTIQKDMSPAARTFSKFIHNPTIETGSEAVGRTIARPTSVLWGSLFAFIFLMAAYLLAKHNGFRLSGFEFIALFAIGWATGLIIDFVRHMVTRQS